VVADDLGIATELVVHGGGLALVLCIEIIGAGESDPAKGKSACPD
jgi:hypothetical protein